MGKTASRAYLWVILEDKLTHEPSQGGSGGWRGERGSINGMENFLDIFIAVVRLLYVHHAKGKDQ